MDQCLIRLCREGKIDYETAAPYLCRKEPRTRPSRPCGDEHEEKRALSVLAAALATAALSAAEPVPRLVGPDWLAANLSNPKIRIIDMRADIRDYWENHIPGGRFPRRGRRSAGPTGACPAS